MKRALLWNASSLSIWVAARTIYHLNNYSAYFLPCIPFTEIEVTAINKAKDKAIWKRGREFPKTIEIKDMMLLCLKTSLISLLLSLKTSVSLRIWALSVGDAAAPQLGAVLTPRHRRQDGNKPQLKSHSSPTAPNKTGNWYYIAPLGTAGVCLPKNNSSRLFGNEKQTKARISNNPLKFLSYSPWPRLAGKQILSELIALSYNLNDLIKKEKFPSTARRQPKVLDS